MSRSSTSCFREGDASTRYKLALAGLGGDGAARRASIRRSERVAAQLSERGHDDCIAAPLHETDGRALGTRHPSPASVINRGTWRCFPLRDQVSGVVVDEPRRRAADDVYLAPILMIAGRARIHASLEGNALYAFLALGLADQRAAVPADGSQAG